MNKNDPKSAFAPATGSPTEAYWERFQKVLTKLTEYNDAETRLRTVMIYHMTENPDLAKVAEQAKHAAAAARRLSYALDAIQEQAESENDGS